MKATDVILCSLRYRNAHVLCLFRLGVLRGILAEVTNASKSPKPVKTDLDILAMLRKRTTSSKAALADFAAAKREDLQDKENAQLRVLDEYSSEVAVLGEDEMEAAISEATTRLKSEGKEARLPDILKLLIGPGGSLTGKPVDRGSLAELVKTSLS